MLGRTLALVSLSVLLGLAQVNNASKTLVAANLLLQTMAQAPAQAEGVMLLEKTEGLDLRWVKALESRGRMLVLVGTCPAQKSGVGYRLGGQFSARIFVLVWQGGVLYVASGRDLERLELVQMADPQGKMYGVLRYQLGLDQLERGKEQLERCP